MFNKKLLPIDEPSLEEANGTPINYYRAVKFHKLDEETLIIDIFKNVGNKVSRYIPIARIFQHENEYLSYVFEEKRWSGASFERLVWPSYYIYEEYNSDIAREYTSKWGYVSQDNETSNIVQLQDKLLEEKRRKKYQNERIRIDREMEKFKNRITKPMKKFLLKDIFINENFMFYDKIANEGFCTNCEKYVSLKGITYKHNMMEIKCPSCHKKVQYKSKNISHKHLRTQATGVIFEKNGKELLARYFDVSKDYGKDYVNPEINVSEVVRTVFEKNKIVNYEKRMFHQLEVNWCKCSPYAACYNYNYDIRYIAHNNYGIYGLKKSLKDTYNQFSEVCEWLKVYGKNVWTAECYLEKYTKYPVMEKLVKLGMFDMAKEMAKRNFKEQSLEEKELHKILNISKVKFKMLNSIKNPAYDLYRCIKENKTNKEYSLEQYKFIQQKIRNTYDEKFIFELLQNVSYYKLHKYLENKDAGLYIDYIKFCKKLEWNLKNTYVLFPKDINKAHDEAQALITYEEKKEQIEAINKRLPEIARKYNFTYKDLVIIAPKDAKEYVHESQELHNCISRNYMGSMASGRCCIVFIRKKSDINKPYYAMEIDEDGKICQVRGKVNCEPNKEVRECVEAFKKKIAA